MKNQSEDQTEDIPLFSMQQLSQILIPKLQPIISILNQPSVDVRALKKCMAEGITDEAQLIRQYAWKLVLGYLPRQRSRWKTQIKTQQQTYNEFVQQFINPQKYVDYPLSISKKDKNWPEYQKDFYMWQQIEKDTCRTQAELSFFSTIAQPILIPFYTNTRREKLKLIRGREEKTHVFTKDEQKTTYRYDYMTRILFIFAKLNPKVEYVQGMNEILAPIFYLVHCAHSTRSPIQEAACFFMFNNVMSDILELHMRDFGKKQNGIHSRMRNISTMLLALQPDIWRHLQILQIDPFYYCFRWITLLFSQQFQMFETLRIWEAIFSYQNRTVYINFFSLALILASKQKILSGQYGQILGYLKGISQHINIENVIAQADQLYQKYHEKDLLELAEKNRKRLIQKQNSSPNRFLSFWKKLF